MTQVRKVIDRAVSIEILKPALLAPVPGSAEPRRDYAVVFRTRANVDTMQGKSEFASVDIEGARVTHKFKINWTSIPFDTRNLLRDARRSLFKILSVENVKEANRELVIYCASVGKETVKAAR